MSSETAQRRSGSEAPGVLNCLPFSLWNLNAQAWLPEAQGLCTPCRALASLCPGLSPVASPPGSWSIQTERGNALVVLRSLLWPGLTFYHAPRTKNCGYIYVGTGEKNMDLPFML